jgi:predicted permease
LIDLLLHDLQYAVRMLRRSPGFTAITVLTLALGIGANTAIFSVVNALLLQSLPLHQPERLLFITASYPTRAGSGVPFSLQAYEALRDGARSFSGVTGFCGQGLTLTRMGEPEQLNGAVVSANFFEVVETGPKLGRAFQPEEGKAGGQPVALISDALWQRRFTADAMILGKTVVLEQIAYKVIGVMPAGFALPYAGTDVWITRLMNFSGLEPELIQHGAGYLSAIGRLKSGVSAAQADAELGIVYQAYRQSHPGSPDADPQARFDAAPLADTLVSDIRPTLLILMSAVGLVLLVACGNVASLVLARAGARTREMAVRASLGGSRGTLVRQLITESLVLAFAGAAIGVLLAEWGLKLVVHWAGADGPGATPVHIDAATLAFTLLISAATGIASGLWPALRISRPDLSSVLRDHSRGTTASASRGRTRGWLVIAQVALSMVLLIAAGLLVESFVRLQTQKLGFDASHGLTMRVSLPVSKYADDIQRSLFANEVLRRLEGVPGVKHAVVSLGVPLTTPVVAPFLADNQPAVPIAERPLAVWNATMPGYFATFGVVLKAGRDFSAADDGKASKKVIISESLARRFWPDQNPVGRHLKYARRQIDAEIVGVAADVKTQGLATDKRLMFYTPYPQFSWPHVHITVRTSGDPASMLGTARRQIHEVDPDLPLIEPRTLDNFVDSYLTQRRQTMFLVAGFATLTLLLAMLGLYGVLSYSVTQRTAEIAVRQALGAQRSVVFGMVLGQALRLALAGVLAGVTIAFVLTRWIASMLYQTTAADPLTFLGVSVLFVLVALAAGYIPAARAMRVNPAAALR